MVRTRATAPVPLEADMPVRDRILAAASRLFYEEGIQAVGIQRIIDEAGIAKASLYAHFPSKDDLVAAYLEAKGRATRDTVGAYLDNPRLGAKTKVLKLFDTMICAAEAPGFRGCAFQNAGAEVADRAHPIRVAVGSQRAWLHEIFGTLAREIVGAGPAAERLAGSLMVLYDGAAAAAVLDGNPSAARHARWAAEKMLG